MSNGDRIRWEKQIQTWEDCMEQKASYARQGLEVKLNCAADTQPRRSDFDLPPQTHAEWLECQEHRHRVPERHCGAEPSSSAAGRKRRRVQAEEPAAVSQFQQLRSELNECQSTLEETLQTLETIRRDHQQIARAAEQKLRDCQAQMQTQQAKFRELTREYEALAARVPPPPYEERARANPNLSRPSRFTKPVDE